MCHRYTYILAYVIVGTSYHVTLIRSMLNECGILCVCLCCVCMFDCKNDAKIWYYRVMKRILNVSHIILCMRSIKFDAVLYNALWFRVLLTHKRIKLCTSFSHTNLCCSSERAIHFVSDREKKCCKPFECCKRDKILNERS